MNQLEYKMKNFLACDRVLQAMGFIVEKIEPLREGLTDNTERDYQELKLLGDAFNSLKELYQYYKKPFMSEAEISAEFSKIWLKENKNGTI